MKYIFVTGGVVSSLGKGLTAASLGALLEQRGLKVGMLKVDPYLNVDSGTMNPSQHGEVYVLDDGAETDLDLGHYERFTNCRLTRSNSISSGQIYQSVLEKERRGEYLGNCVQVIPHVTNEIKDCIIRENKDGTDVLIVEIGGTTGDIEGLPFLEAIRQLTLEIGKENVLFMHVTLLPFLKAAGELKTKPTQLSVARLREIGIQPDILICRTECPIDIEMRKKISLFCNVPVEAVIEEGDVEFSIYELPLRLNAENLDKLVVEKLGLKAKKTSMNTWEKIVMRLKYPKHHVKIGVVGKYVESQDAYKSIYESLTHAGIANDCGIELLKIDAEILEEEDPEPHLSILDGILIPGGFGDRGTFGKILAAKFARENKIPFFGICFGLQIAVIEFARNVVGLKNANSTEFDSKAPDPVIHIMEDQKKVTKKGATMRLGAYACKLVPTSRVGKIYAKKYICERHRHRYEFNNKYKKELEKKGIVFSGINEKLGLVEIIENKNHPWYVGVQFHPEFQSKPNTSHPLFRDYIKAAMLHREKTNI